MASSSGCLTGGWPSWKESSMFTIELTSGSSWSEPIKTIDRRKCNTISLKYAAAEALHWLLMTQKNVPTWDATHYRVIHHDCALTGGPSSPHDPELL